MKETTSKDDVSYLFLKYSNHMTICLSFFIIITVIICDLSEFPVNVIYSKLLKVFFHFSP